MDRVVELESFAQEIMDNGCFFFIKFDGGRKEKKITIIIDFPKQEKKKMIKIEGDELKTLLIDSIKAYNDVV